MNTRLAIIRSEGNFINTQKKALCKTFYIGLG